MKKIVLPLFLSIFMILCSLQLASGQADMGDIVSSENEAEALVISEDIPAESIAVINAQPFKAGGRVISIPQPSKDLLEVGYDVREQLEVFVIAQNRLLSAYMLASEKPRFSQGEENFILSQSAAIQVFRQGEYQDFGKAEFDDLVEYEETTEGSEMATIAEETEEEMNRRMDALNLNKVKINTPVDLGALFSKPNAYSFGMIVKYADAGKSWTTVISTTYIRVRDRLLFAYVTAKYDGTETVKMVTEISENWADAILEANK